MIGGQHVAHGPDAAQACFRLKFMAPLPPLPPEIALLKSGYKRTKYNHLAIFTKAGLKSEIQLVGLVQYLTDLIQIF